MVKMDGRKFDWIRKQLGLSKVELARRLGNLVKVSIGASGTAHQNLWPWRFSGCGTKIGWEDCSRKQANRKNKQCKNQEANRGIADRTKKSKFFVESVTHRYIIASKYPSPVLSERERGRNESAQ